MASQVSLPTNWNDIRNMPENNPTTRGDKVDAIHDFMQVNRIDSSRFENEEGLIWPDGRGSAAAQKQQITNMMGVVEQEHKKRNSPSSIRVSGNMGSSSAVGFGHDEHNEPLGRSSMPQSPDYGFHSPGVQQQQQQQSGTKEDEGGGASKFASSAFRPISRADDSGEGGGIGGGGGPHSGLIQQRTTIFHVYQQEIMRLVKGIRQQRFELPGEQNRIALMRAVEEHVYALFFGHLADGTRTLFYKTHGAAPIAGMNAQELAYVAGVAKSLDRRLTQHSEDALGFLRDMLANITHHNRGAPFNYIYGLMKAVIGVHEAAQSLIRANPLFAEHRNLVAQEGGYAVRTIPQHIIALLLRGGTNLVRSMFVAVDKKAGTSMAQSYNDWVSVVNRDGGMAIDGFQRALDVYDRVYQAMPARYENFLTLPFAPGMAEYDVTQDRVRNKPDGALIAQARVSWDPHKNGGAYPRQVLHLVEQARGHVLENPIPCYPRFLTMMPPNEPGPVLAYYYALHGGQQQYLAEGRKWLDTKFYELGTEVFAQRLGALLGTLERIHQRALPQIRAGRPIVVTPRTLAAVGRGDAAPLHQKMMGLARHQEGSVRAMQAQVYGRDFTGAEDYNDPGVNITSGRQLLAASTPPVPLSETQEQLRREREQQVLEAAQARVALDAIKRLEVQNETLWRENKYTEFKAALKARLVAGQSDSRPTRQGHSVAAYFKHMAATLNTRLPVMVGTPPNTTPALTSDGKPRQVALYQILISTGIMDILHGLEAVHLQPQLEGQAPGHLSKEKHPVLVFLSRRLITGELKGYRGKADGLSLLLGSMGAQLIGHAQAGRPLQLTGMQRKGGPSVYLPATAVQAVATEISRNPQWMAYIKNWNRAVGGVRAAKLRRTAKKAEQGGSSGSGGGGGGWRGYFGQGGRRKRTRKHKKKKKRTRRHKYRHKRTRHHRRKKKHTRKH